MFNTALADAISTADIDLMFRLIGENVRALILQKAAADSIRGGSRLSKKPQPQTKC
jgi:hypothetical protein